MIIRSAGQALGRRKPLFTAWSIPFPPDLGEGGSLTLRDLIARVVSLGNPSLQGPAGGNAGSCML